MRATIMQAIKLMRVISPIAHRHGFLASLYGSVLIDGTGRDIDLLLVPWRTSYDIQGCIEEIRSALMAVHRSPTPYHGLMNSVSVCLEAGDGAILDLQFSEATIREMEYRPV